LEQVFLKLISLSKSTPNWFPWQVRTCIAFHLEAHSLARDQTGLSQFWPLTIIWVA
jgi:hypothetical protein